MTWGQLSDKIDIEDREALGRQCLEFTNEFRKQHGKPPLKWEPLMFDIAFIHSKNMGDQKVAFGHDGFNLRSQKMPFSKASTGENVAFV
ncbi:CAP domain-containing protein, partial [Listeria monocytogenes]|uniref:CAP domain-containing protein n=1 Tax=Listeria monocytogenes TaxID=1639 RepID=UPI003B42F888